MNKLDKNLLGEMQETEWDMEDVEYFYMNFLTQ